jgi:hypothetical protein
MKSLSDIHLTSIGKGFRVLIFRSSGFIWLPECAILH